MENNIEIVDPINRSKFVRNGCEDNGHDCWGKMEIRMYKYVLIDGIEHRIYDHHTHIIHNGSKVLRLG